MKYTHWLMPHVASIILVFCMNCQKTYEF